MNPLDPATLPLRDIHLPLPVDGWPPAPGWWLVALVVASLVAAGVVRWRRDRFRHLLAHARDPAEERGMTPRLREERGFVLSMVIFAVAALSIAGTALFLVVQSENAMANAGASAEARARAFACSSAAPTLSCSCWSGWWSWARCCRG